MLISNLSRKLKNWQKIKIFKFEKSTLVSSFEILKMRLVMVVDEVINYFTEL